MKKSTFNIQAYIPLLVSVVMVIGTIVAGVLTVISNQKATDKDIQWLKDEIKEIKQSTKSINASVNKTDNVIEGFSEFIGMLEAKMNEPPPVEVKKKEK